ncbi:MAG: acyl-CoA thioesterase [Lachnospiraceae bacterium]|nr:acyl-CoA thioesterase [Lachnospiraceae bacterium]
MEYQVFKRSINYYETDKMQVVHHSNYIRFLEECRMNFLKQLNLDYYKLEEKGIMIPVLSVSCDYKSPVRFGETVCIIPKVEKFHGVKFKMSYRIYSEDYKVLHNEAESSHCFLNFDFKPVHLKRDFPEIYDTMKAVEGTELVDF